MILISSFYNEEYLLPWWLEHHKKIFNHGVLFNYYSTDKSVEIIKKICPSWEIRDTKYEYWNPVTNDKEFMEAEEEFDDYKMTLTTTEFLVGELPKLPKKLTAYAVQIIRMVDNEPDKHPSYEKPLVEQKNFGVFFRSIRRRYLHNYQNGQYKIGRDRTELQTVNCDLKIIKYVYSPWNDLFKKRRLQMSRQMDKEHLNRKNWSRHHRLGLEQLEAEYNKIIKDNKLTYFNSNGERNYLLHP